MDRTIEKRRPKNPRPICPKCEKDGLSIDLKNVYEVYRNEDKKQRWRKIGKHCPNCDYIRKASEKQ